MLNAFSQKNGNVNKRNPIIQQVMRGKAFTELSNVQRKHNGQLAPDSREILNKLGRLQQEMKTLLLKPQPQLSERQTTKSNKTNASESTIQSDTPCRSKLDSIRANVIGLNTAYTSPLNIQMEAVYVDHTATNRAYKSIEDMIQCSKQFTANPHTEFSHFGKYSTEMMHYAHDSLLSSFSASAQQYVALPTGSGSTGAVERTIRVIAALQKDLQKPTVYLTPYEHHSNILPWVEYYEDVNELASDPEGNLIFEEIEQQLLSCSTHRIIVSASAASNVTSKLTDLVKLNAAIKKVRKQKEVILAIDCAAYCCHHELNLTICDQIDFVFLSPHKNLGGAQSCGVLIARKRLMNSLKPTFPGGGTVAFVKGYSREDVMYDVDIFNRQIAGTPPFLGFYRAALSFELLKNRIGYEYIHSRETANTSRFVSKIEQANQSFSSRGKSMQILVYGDIDFEKRANVITLNIIDLDEVVQHSFVSVILADVFGIQLRSGCFCAGPYGMKLLKLTSSITREIEAEVRVGILKGKPGYIRLDLTFYLETYEVDYVANAIIAVAEYYRNMQLIYTICNDGQITRHKMFHRTKKSPYSLDNDSEARETILKERQTNPSRLSNRQITLASQLERGIAILRSPIEFLREQQPM